VKLRVLDLFSGIGGFSLGLERTNGFETVAFCEIEPYCRRVLAKHWPGVPCYDDVRTLTAGALSRDGIAVDVICGGFPCQDISFAGKRAGLEGARSGLWSEYARLIGELRPRFVIVENVPGLLSLGMGDVLGSLSTLGYDAVWDCIPASAVGAPHRRDRVWLVGYSNNEGQPACAVHDEAPRMQKHASDPNNSRLERRNSGELQERSSEWTARPSSPYVADAESAERAGFWTEPDWKQRGFADGGWWQSEPNVGRVANGISARVDRLKALGNSVVPQVVQTIGRAILEAEWR